METNVKKYITSLLTSTPLLITMQELDKDYRNTIGEAIPYQKLGYNSLEHFLRSIPDTVQVYICKSKVNNIHDLGRYLHVY